MAHRFFFAWIRGVLQNIVTFCEKKLFMYFYLHIYDITYSFTYAYKNEAMDDQSNDGSSFYRLSNRLLLFASNVHSRTSHLKASQFIVILNDS